MSRAGTTLAAGLAAVVKAVVMLNIGDSLPTFALPCTDGSEVSNVTLLGHWAVLFFYPKDMTPGCTTECKDYSAIRNAAKNSGVRVYGISKDTLASHTKFVVKESLTVPLLADPEKTVHQAFGAWGEKMMYGKPVTGTIRSTFLVNPQGRIAHVWPKVTVAGHAAAVMAKLGELFAAE